MFNLLVKSQSWGDGRDTIPDDRAFEYTEQPLVDKFKPGGQLDLKALAALPTLFVQETSGQNAQVARVGTITSARMNAPNIVFEYTYDPGIPAVPNKTLQGFAVDLDINKYEFSRTHWSVKGVDLYRTLLRKFRRQRPKVFQLAEYENIEPSLVSAMMPFNPSFDDVYAAIQRTAKTVGLRCLRADDIWETHRLFKTSFRSSTSPISSSVTAQAEIRMSSTRLASRTRLVATSS